MFGWIQDWYKSQCNGDWEHENGIKIETLDNLGWSVEIDFKSTDFEVNDMPWQLFEESKSEWDGYSVVNNVFNGAGDPLKLNTLLELLRGIVEKNSSSS